MGDEAVMDEYFAVARELKSLDYTEWVPEMARHDHPYQRRRRLVVVRLILLEKELIDLGYVRSNIGAGEMWCRLRDSETKEGD